MYNMYGMTEEKVSLCEYWEDEEHEAPDLPEELWACICEEVRLTEERDYVCEDNNRETLLNIALSSSVLYAAALSQLFHTISVSDRRQELLRPLEDRPDLGKLVKVVRWSWRLDFTSLDENLERANKVGKARLRRALRILHCLPNVTSLYITLAWSADTEEFAPYRTQHFDWLVTPSTEDLEALPFLSTLSEVHLVNELLVDVSVEQLLSWLANLPRIRQLHLENVAPTEHVPQTPMNSLTFWRREDRLDQTEDCESHVRQLLTSEHSLVTTLDLMVHPWSGISDGLAEWEPAFGRLACLTLRNLKPADNLNGLLNGLDQCNELHLHHGDADVDTTNSEMVWKRMMDDFVSAPALCARLKIFSINSYHDQLPVLSVEMVNFFIDRDRFANLELFAFHIDRDLEGELLHEEERASGRRQRHRMVLRFQYTVYKYLLQEFIPENLPKRQGGIRVKGRFSHEKKNYEPDQQEHFVEIDGAGGIKVYGGPRDREEYGLRRGQGGYPDWDVEW